MEASKIMTWCWDNGIKIYPKPVLKSSGAKSPKVNIEINYNGQVQKGTEIYSQDKKGAEVLYRKIIELYSWYYARKNS
jgi:hypothetical protein